MTRDITKRTKKGGKGSKKAKGKLIPVSKGSPCRL